MSTPSPHSRPTAPTRPPAPAAGFVVPVPPLVVSAGAGGARLSIRLLLATDLVLPAGQLQLLHDPVGLTGDRLLAHVYHAFSPAPVDRSEPEPLQAHTPQAPALQAPALRWLVVQAPLSQLWPITDALAERAWRLPRERPGGHLPVAPLGSRVAERTPMARVASADLASRGILLLSESGRRDALAPHASARLLSRAIRRGWSVLAVTRDGPVSPSSARPVPPWRQHLICRNGMLVPVAG